MALLVASPITTAAAAEPTEQERAKQMFQAGETLYDVGRFEEALNAWQLSYNLSKEPLVQYTMVSALEKLARWPEALEMMQAYRAAAPADEYEMVDRRIAGITARIDDEKAEADRLAEAERKAAEAEERANAQPTVVIQEAPRKQVSVPAVLLYSGGAAALGTGAAFTAKTLSARSAWQGGCVDGLCQETSKGDVTTDKKSSVVADVGITVGLVATGLGTYVAIKSRKKNATTSTSDLQLQLSPTKIGVGGSF